MNQEHNKIFWILILGGALGVATLTLAPELAFLPLLGSGAILFVTTGGAMLCLRNISIGAATRDTYMRLAVSGAGFLANIVPTVMAVRILGHH